MKSGVIRWLCGSLGVLCLTMSGAAPAAARILGSG